MRHSQSDENLHSPRFGGEKGKSSVVSKEEEKVRKISPSPIPKLRLSVKDSLSSDNQHLKPRFKNKESSKLNSLRSSNFKKVKGKIPEIEGLYEKYNEDGTVNLEYYDFKEVPRESKKVRTMKKKRKKERKSTNKKKETLKKRGGISNSRKSHKGYTLDIFLENPALDPENIPRRKKNPSTSGIMLNSVSTQCHNFSKESDPKNIEKQMNKLTTLIEILNNITEGENVTKKIPYFRQLPDSTNKSIKDSLSKYLKLKKNYSQAKKMIKEYEKAIESNINDLKVRMRENRMKSEFDKIDNEIKKSTRKEGVDKCFQVEENKRPPIKKRKRRNSESSLNLYNPNLNNIYSDFEDDQLSELNRSMGKSVSSFLQEEKIRKREKNTKKNFGGFLNVLFSQSTVIENLIAGKINLTKEENEKSFNDSQSYVLKSKGSVNNEYSGTIISGRESNIFFN